MKEETIDKLLEFFLKEHEEYSKIEIPNNVEDKRKLLRGIINLRDPVPVPRKILELEDHLLEIELWEKGIVSALDMKEVDKNISVYFGDITTIKADGIVDAGNETGLGCFIPSHHCIDNTIHTSAGIRLRLECFKRLKGRKLKNGELLICKGYNLPCKYVIITVGPRVFRNVTVENERDLKKCYENAMDYAIKHKWKTIVFPCISTGVFGYPIEKARIVAVHTIKSILKKHNIKVVFNVYSNEDYEKYMELFPKEEISQE